VCEAQQVATRYFESVIAGDISDLPLSPGLVAEFPSGNFAGSEAYWNGLNEYLQSVIWIRLEQLFVAGNEAVALLHIKTHTTEYRLAEHLTVEDEKITRIVGYRGPDC